MAAADSFPRERLERLAEMERGHFWFAGRDRLLLSALDIHLPPPARILDVGCGTGHFLEVLARRGHRPVGLDVRPEGLRAVLATRGGIVGSQGRAEALPFRNGVFDAVLACDLLEHVDDGRTCLEIRRMLRPDGIFVMCVPAFPALWSYRDVGAGHLRRYTRASLASLIHHAGLRLEWIRFYQCLLLPVLAISRLLGRRGPALRDTEDRPPALLNTVFRAVNLGEVHLGRWVPWPWGSSLIALARPA